MAGRGIPEVTPRIRPNIDTVSGITRSKPTISSSTSSRISTDHSSKKSIVGLSAPTKMRSIGSVVPSVNTRSRSIDKINPSVSSRAKGVDSISSANANRAKTISHATQTVRGTPPNRDRISPVVKSPIQPIDGIQLPAGRANREIPTVRGSSNIRSRNVGAVNSPNRVSPRSISKIGSDIERSRPKVGTVSGSTTPSRFFSIKGISGVGNRERPNVGSVSGSTPRSKVAIGDISGTGGSGVKSVSPITNNLPRATVGGGPIQRNGGRRSPLTVSDLY